MKNRLITLFVLYVVCIHMPISAIQKKGVPIKIGISMALSGPARDLGERLLEGIKPVIQNVNQEGGINGRDIQLIIKDDQYNPELTLRNTIDMLQQDQVDLFFSFVGTPTVTKIVPLILHSNRMMFFPFTGAQALRSPLLSHHVFNNRSSYWNETQTLVDYLVAQGKTKIAIFYQQDSFGQDGRIGAIKALRKHDLKPAISVNYRRNQFNTKQVEIVASLIQDAQSDAVICIAKHLVSAKLIRTIRDKSDIPIANISFADPVDLVKRLIEDDKSANKEQGVSHLLHSIVVPYDKVVQTIGHFDPIAYEGHINTKLLIQILKKTPLLVAEDFQNMWQRPHRSFIIQYKDGSWTPI